RRHGSRTDKANKHRYGAPQYVPEHDDEPSALEITDGVQGEEPLEIPEETTSTAVTIVGSTPSFGIGTLREQRDGEENNALGVYESEPPKKRQRSAAAVILGAAVETVIFTSAVALSAYQLLTGKGKQQLEASMASTTDDAVKVDEATFESKKASFDENVLMSTKSAPVNIPTRHKHSGQQLGKSLHHHHKSKHSLYKSRHGLSISLPHAYDYGEDHMGDLIMPERPKTGTEDNDEQFLRMEAQISNLITEGKRQLKSGIPDLA
ncbi:hypothetical protein BGZ65_002196, partial [Modicella reniformis]